MTMRPILLAVRGKADTAKPSKSMRLLCTITYYVLGIRSSHAFFKEHEITRTLDIEVPSVFFPISHKNHEIARSIGHVSIRTSKIPKIFFEDHEITYRIEQLPLPTVPLRVFKEHADCSVENTVTAVPVSVCEHHDTHDQSPYVCSKFHSGLIGNQGVGATAKFSTCADQNGKNHGVSTAADAADDQEY